MHDQPRSSRAAAATDHQAELLALGQPGGRWKHGLRSGGQAVATPATTRGHDGATRAGTHAQPEPVLAGASTVVRLEGALALAHGGSPRYFRPVRSQACARPDGSVKMSPPAEAVIVSSSPPKRRGESARGATGPVHPRPVLDHLRENRARRRARSCGGGLHEATPSAPAAGHRGCQRVPGGPGTTRLVGRSWPC